MSDHVDADPACSFGSLPAMDAARNSVDNSLQPVKLKRSRAPPKLVNSHPSCEKCLHVKKRKPGQPSAWNQFLKNFQSSHPDLNAGSSIIEARKRYVPPNGRAKSYERIFKEVWKARNPAWKTLYREDELEDKIRADFLDKL